MQERAGAASHRLQVRRVALGLALLCTLALASCGFHLRRPPDMAFHTVYADVTPSTVLGAELIRQFARLENVELITEASRRPQAQVILDVKQNPPDRNVVGVGATGEVREIQLRLQLRFRLRTPEGKELIPETEISQERDISYSETGALAKEQEEVLLYRSMQANIVRQLMRRLSAVREL